MQKDVHLFNKVRQFAEKLEEKGGKPLYELELKEAREVLLEVQEEAAEGSYAEVEQKEIEVDVEGGRMMRLKIIKPKGVTGDLGVIYYIHGGGWVMGDDVTHQRLVSELAADVPAAVVFPMYTQAPEGQFPEVIEDLFSALKHIASHGDKYGLNASHLAVAGDSAGGNMATVMTLMAKENGFTPTIDFQLLLYPVTNADFETESYGLFAEGPWLTKKAMEWFWDQYLPDKEKRKSKEASPLLASVAELKDLPPALVITGENDVLRDEGEAYARKLDAAGVKTISARFNGVIHDFMMLNALSDVPATRAAMSLSKAKLRWFLYGTK